MSLKLGIEPIENGFIITREEGKVYRETPALAITEAQLALDSMKKSLMHPKTS
jgi:hypothetical protein